MAIFLTGLIAGVILGGGLYLLFRALNRNAVAASFGSKLFLVKIPRDTSKQGEVNLETEIGKFEQFLSGLGSLQKPVAFEIAVPHVGEEIHFYISVPKELSEVVPKQVQGIWNGASVEPASDDYTIFNPQGSHAGAYLLEKESYVIPLRTYREIGSDSFAPILGGFAKVNEIGEGAAIQIMVRPAPEDAKKRIHGALDALKRGESHEKAFGGGYSVSISDVAHVFNPETKEEKEKEQRIVDENAVKAVETKLAKPLFSVNVRLLASASSPFQANELLDGLISGFHQFGSSERNDFKIIKQKNPAKLLYQFIFRKFEPAQTMVLTAEEVASLYHFPIASTDAPRVKWLKSKEAPPPSNLEQEGTRLGESVFRGETKPVYLTDDDRRRHVYTIGQTGTGKSTLLANMAIEDIRRGKAIALIDPHGDLAEKILAFVPPEREKDVIYFDPSDLDRPLGINMLDFHFDRPEEKTFIVNEMQSIFNKLFTAETMGPMFEQYMRNALLLMMEDMPNEPATLVEVPRIFTDTEYRKRKLSRIANPVVIDFWEKEAAKAGGEASLSNMTPYITSKFNNFISNDYMRPIIGQPKSAFNFREVMDQGKILLINLSKGRIGDINANLLGMVITGKLLMAALSRVDAPEAARRDFNLYIDEFQNFTTDSIATILSEARKYRLNLTMAHQFIAQLDEKIRDAVFGNVGSQIVFRVGAQDAEFLVKQFEPTFSQNDLLNIDNLNAYVKLLVRGETSKPFNIKIGTESWAPGNRDAVERIKTHSRETYGGERRVIEEGIAKRLRE